MPGITIIGTGRYVPGEPVSNDALARVMDTDDAWIKQRTGIAQPPAPEQRHHHQQQAGGGGHRPQRVLAHRLPSRFTARHAHDRRHIA